MDNVRDISFGRAHALILTNDLDLYVIGLYGGKGISDLVEYEQGISQPTKIMSDIVYMHAGGGESCAINSSGELFVWYDDL